MSIGFLKLQHFDAYCCFQSLFLCATLDERQSAKKATKKTREVHYDTDRRKVALSDPFFVVTGPPGRRCKQFHARTQEADES